MEQAINDLAKMLGVGAKEIYAVLQSMAKIDAQMEFLAIWFWSFLILFVVVFLVVSSIFWFLNQESTLMISHIITVFVLIACVCGLWSSIRNYKMWSENPKAYAIEKIINSIKEAK